MKINSTILAAAIGLASVSLVSAQQYVYITGSTAARGAVYNALVSGVGFDNAAGVVSASYGSSNPTNGSYMVFSNTVTSAGVTTPTIVKCHWSGSEAGVVDVSGAVNESFLTDSTIEGGNSTAGPTGTQLITNTVDLALADNALAYSKNSASSATQKGPIVVVPFVFVKNTTTLPDAGNIANITDNNFKVLAGGGDYISLFTGNTGDTNYVYLAGRDDNSGTRVNTLGDTGYGIAKNVNQIQLSGGQMSPAGYTDEGQSSGGTLAQSLNDTSSALDPIQTGIKGYNVYGFVAVAYLGLADDATAEGLAGGSTPPTPACTRLTYNGVAYSTAAVEDGTYAFWGNEYILHSATASAQAIPFWNALGNKTTGISAYTDNYEIPLANMHVTRSGPLNPPVY
jgi:hypothetical protein